MNTSSLITTAYAQSPAETPAAPQPGAPSMLASFAPLVLVFAIFYFLVIRPQRKQEKERQEALSKLNPGDEVVSNSGIYGKIHSLTEKTVQLEIAPNVRVKIARNQIMGVVKE